MIQCPHCGKEVNTDEDPDSFYTEVVSWVTGPKLDHPIMREQTGRFAHKKCVENLQHGQAPDQPELFTWDDESTNTPVSKP
jgi:hypothetical protein